VELREFLVSVHCPDTAILANWDSASYMLVRYLPRMPAVGMAGRDPGRADPASCSTIRLRHRRTKGSGSRKASLTMMFKLAQSASRRWRRLNGHHQIVLVLEGKVFTDGVLQNAA
jgi:hypothetical protein